MVHKVMDIPECMSIQDIQQATLQDEHLQQVNNYIQGCSASRNEIP